MTDSNTSTLKEIVTDNFQAAAIFEKYSLDFCCRGGKTVEQACVEKGVRKEVVLQELRDLLPHNGQSGADRRWQTTTELINHIVATHHAYIRTIVPVLLAHTRKVASVHGEHYPEVIDIARRFEEVAAELLHHMMKEEHVLFPYVESVAEALQRNTFAPAPPFGTVRNPIRVMEAEHQAAGDELYEIRSLSGNYAPPPDACTTYRVTYQELREFERDLHQHVHLENNILFPMALAQEEQLLSTAQQSRS